MRTLSALLLICCIAGCAALPDSWRYSRTDPAQPSLSNEVEELLDQPLIDPLTRFLQEHAAQADTTSYQRIARERDSRCRAIGTRYEDRAATAQNLQILRNGYQYSCPEQVETFAQRLSHVQTEQPSHTADAPATALPPQASQCYLLFTIRNYQQAIQACTASAEAGDAKSQHHLASILRTDRAMSEALHWAQKSAAEGYPPGQLLLAELYQRGHGAPGDAGRALPLFEAAAEQGLAAAQYQTGMAWLNGIGTEPDRSTALHWLKRAADQGEVAAQLQLAELYFSTPGAEQPEARQWLKRAAVLGSATAQYRLGVSYLEGSGGPADPLEAYVWLSLALLNGEQRARDGVEQLASQLSPSQLDSARQKINARHHARPH